jgi:2,3-bisphosphoglycerate-dependent phosphoglycerate mutase
MVLLLLARHGETVANRQKRFQGHKDYPLNSLGEEQAGRLAKALERYPVEAVFASDLARAHKTALLAVGTLPIYTHPFFREYSFGVAEGLTRQEIETLYPRLGQRLKQTGPEGLPGAEDSACFTRRLMWTWRFFSCLPKACCLLVSHGRFINAFLTLLITGRERPPYPFPVSHTSLSAVTIKEGTPPTLLFYNDTCHLENF